MTEHVPFLRIEWCDPETGVRGYAVVDQLVHGISGGGLRMRPGVTMQEVEGLARTMSIKKGLMKAVGGGSKGGIDCDPRDPRARQVLKNFIKSLSPIFSRCWSTGEDMGVRQDVLEDIFEELGLGYPNQATLNRVPDREKSLQRMASIRNLKADGADLATNIGGYGVAEAVAASADKLGWKLAGLTCVVQGFGSMGGAAARYLTRMGVKVIGAADAEGFVRNDEGLDIEAMFWARSDAGEIDRSKLRPADRQLPRDEWMRCAADILIPAALGGAIHEGNCDSLQAKLVVEAANLATTPPARRKLHERGVVVIPDFAANSSTSAWFTWVAFGEVGLNGPDSFAKVKTVMRDNIGRILDLMQRDGMSPVEAGTKVAVENIATMIETYGERYPIVAAPVSRTSVPA